MAKVRYFKRMRSLVSAKDALAHLFALRGGKGMAQRLALWQRWEEVVGPELASLGVPLDCKGANLMVAAYDSMAMQELKMQADILLDLANSFLGARTFAKVTFTLLDDRTPLNALPQPKPVSAPPTPQPLPPPADFGHLREKLDPNTIVGRCYRAVCEAYRQN